MRKEMRWMADTLIKMKTGSIDALEHEVNSTPTVPLDRGSIYFAVDTNTHIGKIVYDAPVGTNGVDRIVMSTQAEYAQEADVALDIKGTLGVPHGGTGKTSFTSGQILVGNGTGAIKSGTIANHSYTPAGTVSVSTNATTNKTATVSPASTGTVTYTPGGTISKPTFTGSSLTSTGNFTPSGTVSVTTNQTTNKTATVAPAASGDVTYTPAGKNSAPAFTGTAATIVVSGGTGTTTYTPAGSIAVSTAGSTVAADDITSWTANTPTAVTGKTVVTSASYASGVLTLSTGDSVNVTPGTAATLQYTGVTVKSGDAAYSFTGTGTRLTASYTPAGSVAAPTFTGTGVRLVTGNIAVPNTYTATFTGTQGSISVSGTPAGTISTPTFTGTGVRLVTGNIAVPNTYTATFSGTAATLSHTINS